MFHTHVLHAIGIQALQVTGYGIRLSLLDNTLGGLQGIFVLAIYYYSLESRLIPHILALVLCEERFQTGCIFGSLIPNLLQRYVEQQYTVVILLHQSCQFGILGFKVLIGISHHLGIAHLSRQVVLGTGLGDKAVLHLIRALVALHALTNIFFHLIIRQCAAFAVQLGYMPAEA